MTLAGGYSTKAATAGLHTGATWVTDSHSLRLKQLLLFQSLTLKKKTSAFIVIIEERFCLLESIATDLASIINGHP